MQGGICLPVIFLTAGIKQIR